MFFEWFNRPAITPERNDIGLIAELRCYWEALRPEGAIPHRNQIDPRGFGEALEHCVLVESVAPGMARVRIAGKVFSELMGMDIRAMPLSCLFMGDARPQLQADLTNLFSRGTALTLRMDAAQGLGRPPLKAQLQLLPLIGSTGRVDLALGCIELTGQLGQQMRRFNIRASHHQNLVPQDSIIPAFPLGQPESFAEPLAGPSLPPAPRPAAPRAMPSPRSMQAARNHLRVISENRAIAPRGQDDTRARSNFLKLV